MKRAKRTRVARVSVAFALSLLFVRAPCAEILLPPTPAAEETQAAAELARVWRLATGESVSIQDSPYSAVSSSPSFHIGGTALARAEASLPTSIDADGFRILVRPDGTIFLHGASPLATRFAVDWFCSHELNVRWFLPGELGEVIPASRWRAHAVDHIEEPAFRSRSLSGLDPAGQAWALQNGLHERWPHAHALLNVIPRTLFASHPDYFPVLEGRRYLPSNDGDYNWQPNLANPAVAVESARYVQAYFRSHPSAEAVSLSENDSIRFDESPETLAARGPLHWFRGRPNYSNLVFGFMNRVADQTAKDFPGKLLSAYAYYWCEDTPDFPIRPSVLPWLTADRTQWYDPAFAREDQALIRRWCHSGAAVVGCYDYLYGAPYIVPRVTTRLTAESIRFEFEAGVRAFTAEASPNWAFDGPKLWVAAQLLWDPRRPVDSLLDEYYRTLFHKAAPAIADFYALCEQAWKSQPGPARWIKFYRDPAQAALFPPPLRMRLRAGLQRAAAAATGDPAAQRRVEFVSTGFAAAEAFCSFCEARVALSNAGAEVAAPPSPLVDAYRTERARFKTAYTRAVSAGALASTDLSPYLRDDPAAIPAPEIAALPWRPSSLRDPAWSGLSSPARLDDTTFVWANAAWIGRGEPSQNRSIRVATRPDGQRTVRFEHAAYDHLGQWLPAVPGALYRASVDFRGTVGLGDEEFLVVSFLDKTDHFVGDAVESRVPPGDWTRPRRLEALVRAPATATLFGIGVYSSHQLPPDYAEFGSPSVSIALPNQAP